MTARPTGYTAEVLTQIYGEEDWSATIRKVDEDGRRGGRATTSCRSSRRHPTATAWPG